MGSRTSNAAVLCETVHGRLYVPAFLGDKQIGGRKGLPEGWRTELIRNQQGEPVGSTQPVKLWIDDVPSFIWKKHRRPGQGAAEVSAAAVARALALEWIPATDFVPGRGPESMVPETLQVFVAGAVSDLHLQQMVIEHLNLFDYLIGNRDRNNGNVLVVRDSGSSEGLNWQAIDHGQAFQAIMGGQWGQPSRLEQVLRSSPLDVDLLQKILSQNPYLTRLAAIPEPRWRALLVSQGLGARDVHSFLRRREHVLDLQVRAIQRLSGRTR